MRLLIFLSAIIFLFPTCKTGKNNSQACNPDIRRKVKLMMDAKACLVDTTPISISIEALGEIKVPKIHWETGRLDLELKTYRVRGIVDTVEDKLDGDIHIRLKSGDKYLITEVPNPTCEFAKASKWNATFLKVIDFIEANKLEGKEVEITGVAFVDVDHHYKRLTAANNIELHPIIKIRF